MNVTLPEGAEKYDRKRFEGFSDQQLQYVAAQYFNINAGTKSDILRKLDEQHTFKPGDMSKLKKPELLALARLNGLNDTGLKADLLNRLVLLQNGKCQNCEELFTRVVLRIAYG